MTDFFLQGLTLGISAGLSPGPLLALFIGRAIQHGWRRTLPAAFAPLLSDGPIIFLVLVVLSQVPEAFLNVLRIGGGLFLLYLAWNTLRSTDQPDQQTEDSSFGETLRSAALINLLNPNPYIFWATILGPILILGWRRSPAIGLSFAGGFYIAVIGVFIAWIITAGTIGGINARVRKTFMILSGVGLTGFGLFQIIAGIQNSLA
jgi:threonine/homoserine/homoserine lactone efflux protein